jgi:hypothetical protein
MWVACQHDRGDVKVRLLDGLSAASCAELDHHAEARDFIKSLDGFWSPLLVAHELGASVATVVSRILEHMLGEINAIEGMPIESIVGRELRVVSELSVSENAESSADRGRGTNGPDAAPAKGVLRRKSAIGATDAKAKENLREMKRQRLPRADVESAGSLQGARA